MRQRLMMLVCLAAVLMAGCKENQNPVTEGHKEAPTVDTSYAEERTRQAQQAGQEWLKRHAGKPGNGMPRPEGEVYDVVERMPAFPGGDKKLFEYIQEHIHYPASALNDSTGGRVVVAFIVEPDGSLSHPEVIRSIRADLDSEAIRVVRRMPRWSPGRQNYQAVRVKYTMPVVFKP